MDFQFSRTYSILLAERDSSSSRFVRELLVEMVCCSVDSVVSGMAAFERGLAHQYDLILADFSMPGLSGPLVYELLGKVYATYKPMPPPMPPVIYLCKMDERQSAEPLAGEPGVRGVLVKPVTVERLLNVLRRALPEDAFRKESPLVG